MRRGVVILMGAAVALRWLFCFVVFPHLLAGHSTVGTQYYFDSYREIAASLLQGCGYRLACNGPVALHRFDCLFAIARRADYTDVRIRTE